MYCARGCLLRTLGRYLTVPLSTVMLAVGMPGCSAWSYLMEQQSSLAPDSTGVAWVACRQGESVHDERSYCDLAAQKVCHGGAVYLDTGYGQPEANAARVRYQCTGQ